MGNQNCATCSHFEQFDEEDVFAFDEEDKQEQDRDYPGGKAAWGVCGLIGHPGWASSPTARAFTQDASNYRSELRVRSDFGCVEHTPKDPT
jgi:hypothetical protein